MENHTGVAGMTISELGSLGEFIGSVAVLVTLIYLAIQVRLVRSESARSAMVDRGQAVRETMSMIVTDDTLARGMMNASQAVGGSYAPPLPKLLKAGLTDLEAFKVQVQYTCMFHLYMIEYSTMDQARAAMLDAGIVVNIAHGTGRLIWDEYYAKVFRKMAPEFADHVSAVIAACDRDKGGYA
jgi:hypothetical protein